MFKDHIFNKSQMMTVLLATVLVACVPATTPISRETTIPTVVSLTSVPTSTFIPVIATPSPLPTQPTIAITPNPTQLERWKEYETALGDAYHSGDPSILCEWEILGQSNQIMYVWAVCMSTNSFVTSPAGKRIFSSLSTPAVIHLGAGGIIESVEIPGPGTNDYQRMFSTEILDKFEYYRFGRAGKMSEHLNWRRTHPEEPPLIVLSTTSTP